MFGKKKGPRPLRWGRPSDDGVEFSPEGITLERIHHRTGGATHGRSLGRFLLLRWDEIADANTKFVQGGVVGAAKVGAHFGMMLSALGDGNDEPDGPPLRGYVRLTLTLRDGSSVVGMVPRRRTWNPDQAWCDAMLARIKAATVDPTVRLAFTEAPGVGG